MLGVLDLLACPVIMPCEPSPQDRARLKGVVSGRLLHFENPQQEGSPTPGDHRLTP
jgi:hypothetical protein